MNKLEQAAREVVRQHSMECLSDKAVDALRKALAKPQVDWKEEAMRLGGLNAKNVGELRKLKAEQAEQEPMYFGLTHDHTWLSISEQQYNKLWEAGRMKVYDAPVRTKDLTDVEIEKVWRKHGGYMVMPIDFARAVIAADRGKNK